MLIIVTCHKLRQIISFWGHNLTSEKGVKRNSFFIIFHKLSLFNFRKRKDHESSKNMVKNSHFYHFPQVTSDCHLLRSLTSFRNCKNHEKKKM